MQYPGGKNQYGFYQKIINLIPPHQTYIETHLGSGAIMKKKKIAEKNIGIDVDTYVIQKALKHFSQEYDITCQDALIFINKYNFQGNEFIYCDPPYLKESRQSDRCIYTYEYDNSDHIKLLTTLNNIPCKIMLSGYNSELYDKYLKNWHKVKFQVKVRSGESATEVLWMNYQEPTELHDYNYLGSDYRERERIKRKTQRWIKNLNMLPTLERSAILAAISN